MIRRFFILMLTLCMGLVFTSNAQVRAEIEDLDTLAHLVSAAEDNGDVDHGVIEFLNYSHEHEHQHSSQEPMHKHSHHGSLSLAIASTSLPVRESCSLTLPQVSPTQRVVPLTYLAPSSPALSGIHRPPIA